MLKPKLLSAQARRAMPLPLMLLPSSLTIPPMLHDVADIADVA
jgi:hypothetical protein